MTLLLHCKYCKHEMKYLPLKANTLPTATKECVYCGKSLRVKEAIVKHI